MLHVFGKRRGPESAKYEHQDRAENEARPGRHDHKVILPGSPQARRSSTAKISIGCSPAPVSRSDRRYTIQQPSPMSTSSTPFTLTNHRLHPNTITPVIARSAIIVSIGHHDDYPCINARSRSFTCCAIANVFFVDMSVLSTLVGSPTIRQYSPSSIVSIGHQDD